MKLIFLFLIAILSLVTGNSYCQNGSSCFPTGMKWQEATVELSPSVVNIGNSHNYEIGADIVINNVTYKEVRVDGVPANLWIREENNKVWLLSDKYPQELKIYDFNWDGEAKPLYTEYLQENEDGIELKKIELPVTYKTICRDEQNYQFHQEGDGIVIRNIGRVHELNRNSSLLGYKLPEEILPGLVYWKVLWIEKEGVVTFKSDSPIEWSTPWAEATGIVLPNTPSKQQCIFNLQGRRVTDTHRPGVYLHDGRKWMGEGLRLP